MTEHIEMRLSLIEQKQDHLDLNMGNIARTLEKMSNAICEIVTLQQKSEAQKDTNIRIFEEIRELKADIKEGSMRLNMVELTLPELKLTSGAVKKAIVVILLVVGLAILGTLLKWNGI